MIDDQILAAVGRSRKTIMSKSIISGDRTALEHRVRALSPGIGKLGNEDLLGYISMGYTGLAKTIAELIGGVEVRVNTDGIFQAGQGG